MTKGDDSIQAGSGRVTRLLTVFAIAAVLVGIAAQLHGSLSGDVAAQADPTPTPIRLVFDTPTPAADPAETPTVELVEEVEEIEEVEGSDETSFTADAWVGGYFRGDAEWYGRPWTSVYGAYSEYPRGTLYVSLTRDPESPVTFEFEGLDDELPARSWIALEVNGQRVYEGESWFRDWDGTGQGENAPWTAVRVTVPPGLLVAGENRFTILNLTESANFGAPPYVLLSAGTVTAQEDDLFGTPDEETISVTVDVEPN